MDNNKGEGAKARFEGFMETFVYYQNKIPPMDNLVQMYLTHLDEMRPENRTAAFSFCCIYVGKINNVSDEIKLLFDSKFEKNKLILQKCTIYGLALLVMCLNLKFDFRWESEECEKVVEDYCKKRYKNDKLKLPKEIETMIYLVLANSYCEDKSSEKQYHWLQRAYDNSNNLKEIQDSVKEHMASYNEFDIGLIWNIINKRFVEE